MKKKMSTAFALVLALMILTATAVAATLIWKDAGERIAPLESENGTYDTWDAAAKSELVKTLAGLGEMADDPDVERLLTEELNDEERGALADRIMTGYVSGGADTVTLLSILEKLHGPIESWPMEDRVWYNDLLAENGMITEEDMPYALPAGEELTQPQAVERASAFLAGIGATDLNTGAVEATLYQEPNDRWLGDTQISEADRKIWSIVFRGCASGTWHVDMTADGAVTGYSTPLLQQLFTTGLLPSGSGIAEAQAIQAAVQAVGHELAGAQAYYGYINHVDAGHAPLGTLVWQVVDADGSRVMVSRDGDVLYTEE